MFGVLGWFLVLVGLRISGTISLRLSLPNKAELNAEADHSQDGFSSMDSV